MSDGCIVNSILLLPLPPTHTPFTLGFHRVRFVCSRYLQALLSVERKSIATREALHTLQAFPELESRIEELISPTTLPRGTLARAASSSHGIIAYGAQGASGGAARQRSDDNRPGKE